MPEHIIHLDHIENDTGTDRAPGLLTVLRGAKSGLENPSMAEVGQQTSHALSPQDTKMAATTLDATIPTTIEAPNARAHIPVVQADLRTEPPPAEMNGTIIPEIQKSVIKEAISQWRISLLT